jgi:DHA1 family bicyclomycin/chloramphenicol resistance-like MFS transporter
MYLPTFADIASSFRVPEADVQMSLAAYFAGLSIGQIIYGPISDRLGRKTPLRAGLALYTLASITCALAPSLEILIGARFVQALGGAAGMVIARAIVRDLYSHGECAKIFSRLVLVMGAAPIFAPFFGGMLGVSAGWRAVFLVLTIAGVLSLAIILPRLPESHPGTRGHTPEHEPTHKHKHGLLGLLRKRAFLTYAISGGFAQSAMFAYITGSPFVMIGLFGVPQERFGWIFGLNALGLMVSSQINARLLHNHSYERILKTALGVLSFLGLALIVAGLLRAGFFVIAPLLFAIVSTLGLTFPNATTGALHGESGQAATASAMLGSLQFVMSSVAALLVSRFHDGTLVPMTMTVGTCGVFALFSYWLMHKPEFAAARD